MSMWIAVVAVSWTSGDEWWRRFRRRGTTDIRYAIDPIRVGRVFDAYRTTVVRLELENCRYQ